jgi:SAM-dependent methyltransferase
MNGTPDSQARGAHLDVQAAVGITRHNGGLAATNELLTLCHVQDAGTVLVVGCGIGAGVAYIAKMFGCHVVGVDISEQMIEWSRQRAHEERVEGRVAFRTADVLNLPFDTDSFDVVICESVLGFVRDKKRAIRECVRVTQPGGYFGLNETLWIKLPPPGTDTLPVPRGGRENTPYVAYGTEILDADAWQALWSESGLHDQVVAIKPLDARSDLMCQIGWVGWRWALRGSSRLLALYVRNPAARRSIKEQFGVRPDVLAAGSLGYGLFAGRKLQLPAMAIWGSED